MEESRGFRPPLFADIRFSHSVRAEGFKGDRFEKALGSKRYREFQALGNEAVVTGEFKIHDASAAGQLLDWAIEAHKEKRRVVFFCACKTPGQCHRTHVAKLLVKEAKRRYLDLVVEEWPGGGPESLAVQAEASVVNALRTTRRSVPLNGARPLSKFAGLPVGSAVEVRSDDDAVWVTCDYARWDNESDAWYLPVLEHPAREEHAFKSSKAALGAGKAYRRKCGYRAHVAKGPDNWSDIRALTVKQPAAWAIFHRGKDVENRPWATKYRGPLLIHAGADVISDFKCPGRVRHPYVTG